MATKGKDAALGKEKSSTSTSTRTPKSSIARSFDKDASTPSEKPARQSLRPTKSSPLEVRKPAEKKQSSSEETSLKQTLDRRRSFDKPRPPSQLLKTPLSSSFRERATKQLSSTPKIAASSPKLISHSQTLKPSSSSKPNSDRTPPRIATSPKPISERTTRTPRNGKTMPVLGKPKSIKKSTNTTSRKEPKYTTAPSTPITSEIKSEQEHQESSMVVNGEETIQADSESEIALEIASSQVQAIVDDIEAEPKILEDEKSENCDPSTLAEQQESEPITHVEAEEKIVEEVDENNHHEDEEHDKKDEENNNKDKEECSENLEESLAADPQHEGTQQGDVEGNEEAKPDAESENVNSKKQDDQGKKETQAYNDVIEETASKLVEQRKNKVLALAGAFETVISLQAPETPR